MKLVVYKSKLNNLPWHPCSLHLNAKSKSVLINSICIIPGTCATYSCLGGQACSLHLIAKSNIRFNPRLNDQSGRRSISLIRVPCISLPQAISVLISFLIYQYPFLSVQSASSVFPAFHCRRQYPFLSPPEGPVGQALNQFNPCSLYFIAEGKNLPSIRTCLP
jgi:hypothetical protein